MDLRRGIDLHRRVPADKWCVTKSEFEAFVEEVYRRWDADGIPSTKPPNPLHSDPEHGPNLHDVNTFVVKPTTLAAGGMSYALMLHPEGLDCEVFVSHSWLGGIFHLRHKIRVAWPQLHRLRNLYCCLLANPQNLDLEEFIGRDLTQSAFAVALQRASHLLVVPNPTAGVYSRLWCVYEAYLGAQWNKIYLLPVMPSRRGSCRYWFRHVGGPLLCGYAVGVPFCLILHPFCPFVPRPTMYGWIDFAYRVLSLPMSWIAISCRHTSWILPLMSFFTSVGCIFVVMDLAWSYQILMRNNLFAAFLHYGWCPSITIANALITVWLVSIQRQKASFEEQKELMQFRSLSDSHCSRFEDEERIRMAIAGSEDEVETAIEILLAAGAYTDNLRMAWDQGLKIERAGMTDVASDVFFSMLLWSLCVLDLLSDVILEFWERSRERIPWRLKTSCLVMLLILYSVTLSVIPFSAWRLEKFGPDGAVFALRTWSLWGFLALQGPEVLGYLRGYDEAEFFNRASLSFLGTVRDVPYQCFADRVTLVAIVSRFPCVVVAWVIVQMGVERWTRMKIWLKGVRRSRWQSESDLDGPDSDSESN